MVKKAKELTALPKKKVELWYRVRAVVECPEDLDEEAAEEFADQYMMHFLRVRFRMAEAWQNNAIVYCDDLKAEG